MEEELITVECLGIRKGIGNYKFAVDEQYKYPVAQIPKSMADNILKSNQLAFRLAQQKKKAGRPPKQKKEEEGE